MMMTYRAQLYNFRISWKGSESVGLSPLTTENTFTSLYDLCSAFYATLLMPALPAKNNNSSPAPSRILFSSDTKMAVACMNFIDFDIASLVQIP